MRKTMFLVSAALILALAAIPALPAGAGLAPLSYNKSLSLEAKAGAEQASLTFNVTAGEAAITHLLFTPPALQGVQGPVEAYMRFSPNPVAELQPGTTQAVTLTIEGLPAPGTYTGAIGLSYDQQITGTVETIAFELVVLAEIDPSEVKLAVSTDAAFSTADVITFDILDEAYTASYIPLFIRQDESGVQPIPNVTLFGTLQDEKNQRISEVVFSATITETAVAATGFTIPAYPGHVMARIKVDNLTRFGDFHGRLGFYYHSQEIHHLNVNVTRQPKPVLKISGEQNNAISLETRLTEFQHTFDIYTSNISAVEALTVTVSAFSFPGRDQIPVAYTVSPLGEPIQVGGLTSVTLQVSAQLPETGTYTSVIALVYGQTRQEVTLSVKRVRPAPTVSLLGIERLNAVGSGLPWEKHDIEFWFTLKETGEQPVTLTLPQAFTVLQQVDPANVKQPVDVAETPPLQYFDENLQPISGALQLEPGQDRRLKVQVQDLGSAGSYSGVLDIAAQDMTDLSQKFSLSVRLSGWIAFFFILLGVAGSWGLTYLGKNALPRLELQRKALRLVRGLRELRQKVLAEAAKPPVLTPGMLTQVKDMFTSLEEQLFELRENASQPTASAIWERLDKKGRLAEDVFKAYQRVAGLKPEALVNKFLPALIDIQADMINAGDSSATNAESKLKKLSADIDSALKEALKAGLETMIKGLEGLKSNPVYADISKEVGDLLTQATQARDGLPDAPLEDSQQKYAQLRFEYTKLMAEALVALVEKTGVAPLGWEDIPWGVEKEKLLSQARAVLQITDLEQAVTAYAAAYSSYLAVLVKGLRQEISKEVYQNEKVKAELEAARRKVELAEKAEQAALAPAYDEASIAVKAMMDKARQEGLIRSGLADAPRAFFNLPGMAALDRAFKEAQRSEAALKLEEGGLTALIWTGKIVIGLISLLLAVVLGMKFLWADQPTWGSWVDMATAALWGFGLNQVTKDSFGGLEAIINKWRV